MYKFFKKNANFCKNFPPFFFVIITHLYNIIIYNKIFMVMKKDGMLIFSAGFNFQKKFIYYIIF